MHFLGTFIIAVGACSSCVSGVTIRNFRTATCKGNYAQCSNVSTRDCCDLSHNNVYTSSLFLGLPTTAIGALCARSGNLNCGTIKKGGHGLSLCLANPNSRGSYWFDCRSCHKRDENDGSIDSDLVEQAGNATGTVTPDIIAIENRQFPIGGNTPQHVTDGLIEHFMADGNYADLPEEIKGYQLAEVVGDER